MPEEISGGGAPSGGAPSTPATPAPVSAPSTPAPQPIAQPSTPAAPVATPTKNPGEQDHDYIRRVHAQQDAQKPAEPVAEPPKPEPVAQPVAAEPAKPEPAKVEPEKPAEAPKAVVSEDPLDALGPLPASKFAQALAEHPELETALEAAGLPKDDLFAALRDGAFGSETRKLGLPDVDSVKFAVETAGTMRKMDLAATEVKRGDLDSTINFVRDVLLPMSYVLDDEGNPRMMEVNENGRMVQYPQTDGTVQVVLDNFRDLGIAQVAADAEALLKSGDPAKQEFGERLMEMAKGIQEYIGGKPKSAEDLPEELRAERASLDAEKATIAADRQKEADAKFETFKGEIRTKADAQLDSMVGGWLDESSLAAKPGDSAEEKGRKEFVRNGVMKEIREGLLERLSQDDAFLAEQEQLGRRGSSPATLTKLVNLYKRYASRHMETIASPVLTRAGAERIRQSQARTQKVATQEQVTRTEPRGGTQPALPRTPQVNETDLMQQSRSELMTELRREPRTDEMIARFRQLIAKSQAVAV